MTKNEKTCQGCEQKYRYSTATDEEHFCSQLCENGKYKTELRKLAK